MLRPGGKLISTVSNPINGAQSTMALTAATFLVDVSSEPLRRIAELIDVVN
jgi:hypothetical protein